MRLPTAQAGTVHSTVSAMGLVGVTRTPAGAVPRARRSSTSGPSLAITTGTGSRAISPGRTTGWPIAGSSVVGVMLGCSTVLGVSVVGVTVVGTIVGWARVGSATGSGVAAPTVGCPGGGRSGSCASKGAARAAAASPTAARARLQ